MGVTHRTLWCDTYLLGVKNGISMKPLLNILLVARGVLLFVSIYESGQLPGGLKIVLPMYAIRK